MVGGESPKLRQSAALYTKRRRNVCNMAFNLRRIRCLATQTTAIGFHLMNRARAFRSIFAAWARLKLDLPLAPPATASASLVFYSLPATYASMILVDARGLDVLRSSDASLRRFVAIETKSSLARQSATTDSRTAVDYLLQEICVVVRSAVRNFGVKRTLDCERYRA